MPAPTSHGVERPAETDAVPLKFKFHNFATHCYNVVGCRIFYNNHDFSAYAGHHDADYRVSQAPVDANYRDYWGFAGYLGVRNFPPPAQVRWKSLDGVAHEAQVDIGEIFRDELILHRVPAADMAHFFEGPVAGEPGIFLEVNDRTLSVFMKMLIPTKTPQIPGNERSYARTDLVLAWSRTY